MELLRRNAALMSLRFLFHQGQNVCEGGAYMRKSESITGPIIHGFNLSVSHKV